MSDKILDGLLPRINELAQLEKKRTLTPSEKKEQKQLRIKYLRRFRRNFRSRLLHTKFYDQNGNEVTSSKVKAIQRKWGLRKD